MVSIPRYRLLYRIDSKGKGTCKVGRWPRLPKTSPGVSLRVFIHQKPAQNTDAVFYSVQKRQKAKIRLDKNRTEEKGIRNLGKRKNNKPRGETAPMAIPYDWALAALFTGMCSPCPLRACSHYKRQSRDPHPLQC